MNHGTIRIDLAANVDAMRQAHAPLAAGDRVAYTDAHFARAFGVLHGCRSRDWATGHVTETGTVDGVPMARVQWRLGQQSDWLRAAWLERV